MKGIRALSLSVMVFLCSAYQSAQATPQYVATLIGDGTFTTYGEKINNLGHVIGSTDTSYNRRDYFVLKDGVVTVLERKRSYTNLDINDAGVMLYDDTLHYADGSTRYLGGATSGMNNLGQVAGRFETRRTDYAAVFGPDGSIVLSGWDNHLNQGADINDAGVMAGFIRMNGANLNNLPVRFVGKEIHFLETYPGQSGMALVINNAGYIAGHVGGHAALWTPEGRLINDQHQILVQSGANLSYVLNPAIPSATPVPEPATWTMFALGLAAICFQMRRRETRPGSRSNSRPSASHA